MNVCILSGRESPWHQKDKKVPVKQEIGLENRAAGIRFAPALLNTCLISPERVLLACASPWFNCVSA
jgi:hypothetical protein